MLPTSSLRVFIGFDASQMVPWNVAAASLRRTSSVPVDIRRIGLSTPLYLRQTRHLEHGYWDEISQAPMASGHAIARFLVPHMCDYSGWALFTDGDVLFRKDIAQLLALADETKAVQVVQHAHAPVETAKMSGEVQTLYARKNWSSVILWNCGHPFNRALTVAMVNALPGRMLHRFCWLEDANIGALPPEWNHLVGVSAPDPDPAIVHYTEGTPDLPGYEHCAFADQWYDQARACKYRIQQPAEARRA